ncbi:hypothetical protein JIN84_02155 [Luteolibacter yonseiensis]|uniref:Uncharacterized protein n=1 Tax=Luteolibacter yonseiensis TaxID=1144680 RepID=A0A934R0T7_9BACT|nr:hypothetical protein [Luteolibacter yonseiensis]MBK1814397.1 hypothetical protein [Luteolibacter yonseiensis]
MPDSPDEVPTGTVTIAPRSRQGTRGCGTSWKIPFPADEQLSLPNPFVRGLATGTSVASAGGDDRLKPGNEPPDTGNPTTPPPGKAREVADSFP